MPIKTYTPPTYTDLMANPNQALRRYPSVQEVYIRHLDYIQEVLKKTPEQYVRQFVLKHETGLILTWNKYPYWLEDCYHFILWNNSVNPRISKTRAKNFLIEKYKAESFVIVENKQSKQSVPNLQHFHVFTQTKLIEYEI